jgi:hypothetical protein
MLTVIHLAKEWTDFQDIGTFYYSPLAPFTSLMNPIHILKHDLITNKLYIVKFEVVALVLGTYLLVSLRDVLSPLFRIEENKLTFRVLNDYDLLGNSMASVDHVQEVSKNNAEIYLEQTVFT